MSNPWPDLKGGQVLFIIDASHRVEEAQLLDWLTEQKVHSNFEGHSSHVLVPIAKNPEKVATQKLAMALNVPMNTLLVPVRVVWMTSLDEKGNTPRLRDLLRGNPRQPSAAQARALLRRSPEKAVCIAAKPATMQELLDKLERRNNSSASETELTEFIANQASLALEVAERRLRGTRYKTPRRVAKNLQEHPRFKEALTALSEQTGDSEDVLLQKAQPIFDELIAIPHQFWQDMFGQLNRNILKMGYEKDMVVDPEQLERLRETVRNHPTALLWTHKTHMDGIAMNSAFFDNDFPVPHMIGGINMAFMGIGYLAKRSGAIFIRRSFNDNLLYKMILRQYIGYLMEKRFPLTWAFEGTRSRLGKLMPPRYGILKYVLEAAHATEANNLHMVPITISYDLIGDVADYAKEQAGGIKRPESLSWFINYLRGFNSPHGRIYLNIGEPVVLENPPEPGDRIALAKTAFQVGVEANKVTPLTLSSLMAFVLLGASPTALTAQELSSNMNQIVAWSSKRGIQITDDFDPDHADHMQQLTDIITASGLITTYDEGPERVYTIAADEQGQAAYYRNTIVHHFVTKSIIELSLLHANKQTENIVESAWAEAERLRDAFKFEFFYVPSDEFRQQIGAELRKYDRGWQKKLDADPAYAMQLLQKFTPLMAHSTLLQFVDAYRVVGDIAAKYEDDETLDEKIMVNASLSYGNQAYMQRRINSKASIAKLLFQNGFKLLENMSLTEAGHGQQNRRKQFSQDFRIIAHRIEKIRSMALPGQMDID